MINDGGDDRVELRMLDAQRLPCTSMTVGSDEIKGPATKKVDSRPLWNHPASLELFENRLEHLPELVRAAGKSFITVVFVSPLDELLFVLSVHLRSVSFLALKPSRNRPDHGTAVDVRVYADHCLLS